MSWDPVLVRRVYWCPHAVSDPQNPGLFGCPDMTLNTHRAGAGRLKSPALHDSHTFSAHVKIHKQVANAAAKANASIGNSGAAAASPPSDTCDGAKETDKWRCPYYAGYKGSDDWTLRKRHIETVHHRRGMYVATVQKDTR